MHLGANRVELPIVYRGARTICVNCSVVGRNMGKSWKGMPGKKGGGIAGWNIPKLLSHKKELRERKNIEWEEKVTIIHM